ncbi:MAG: adenylyl-sulfate kinase [Spirochaetaceae bacterium]|jgi:adenylylsulfate kinase-like enzyme|nr:adenylyl-sulfate kinase [Spirochaetaceae bacterium]
MHKLVWITGLQGAGKSTIAREVFSRASAVHTNTLLLDGDDIRAVFGNDLGYNVEDRKENAWRVARLCKYLYEQKMNVICATVSLYREIHEFIYSNFTAPLVVYIDVPRNELERRNQKKLYTERKELPGIDQYYDIPEHADFVMRIVNTGGIHDAAKKIIIRIGL